MRHAFEVERIAAQFNGLTRCQRKLAHGQRGVAGRIAADHLHAHARAQELRQPAPECAADPDDADDGRFAVRPGQGAHSGS